MDSTERHMVDKMSSGVWMQDCRLTAAKQQKWTCEIDANTSHKRPLLYLWKLNAHNIGSYLFET